MSENKKDEDFIYLATCETGEEIYWDSQFGVKNPEFIVIKDKKVGKIPFPFLPTFLTDKTFSTYIPNIWF